MAFCENCGIQLPDNALFCPGCGTKTFNILPVQPEYRINVNNVENIIPEKKKLSKHGSTSFWLWFIVIACGIGILGLVLLTEGSSSFGANANPNYDNYLEVNLYEILSRWDDNALKAKQEYGNKVIKTTGVIFGIYTDGSVQLQIGWLEQILMSSFMMGITTTTIMVYFNKAEMTKLANLSSEQTITVRGVYDGDRNIIRNAIFEPEN